MTKLLSACALAAALLSGCATNLLAPGDSPLPAGLAIPVVLFNGVDVGTSSASRFSMMPMRLDIADISTLPGARAAGASSCYVMADATGGDEVARVYVKARSMSCQDARGNQLTSTPVSGFVVGDDEVAGVPGEVKGASTTIRVAAGVHAKLMLQSSVNLAWSSGF